MPKILEIDAAIAGEISSSGNGWIAGVVCSPDTDSEFLEDLGRFTVTSREGLSLEAWSEAFCATQMSLDLIASEKGSIRRTTLGEAPAIYGPALLGGSVPVVAWVETDRASWRLCVFQDGHTQVLMESVHPLRNPALARDEDGRLWVGYDVHEDGMDRIYVLCADEISRQWGMEGRRPVLASTKGWVWLAGEQRGKHATHIGLRRFALSGTPEPLELSSSHPWNFLPHLFAMEDELFLAWESTPGFAPDDRQAFFREIQLRQIDARTGRIDVLPGTLDGTAPIEIEAFEDRSVFNRIPIYPRLFGNQEKLWLAYRSFRLFGHKCFGWDLLAIPLQEEHTFEPYGLSSAVGFPDTRYGVCLTKNGQILAAAHRMTHEPQQRLDEAQVGRTTQPAWNHRVEIYAWSKEELSHPGPRSYVPLPPRIPSPLTEHCPDPAELSQSPPGVQLVWGDLHAHTCYSKCMPANDGSPEDVLRFHRDALGCQVLTLTDHIEYMSAIEFRHVMNELAAEASDEVVVLYGVEWAKHPAHHTNFFAYERDVFDRLRAILLAESDLQKAFARIKAELPPESVVAIRHFHGMRGEPYGIDGKQTTATYDSDLEWAMEAAQTRGDMMFRPPERSPFFPSNFIQAGAEIGLVGGSDHSRGGSLKFCLTGFWVEELTPQAVFAAISQRRTIACASGKIAMWASLTNGTMQVHVSSPTALMSADLWYDGEWVERMDLSGKNAKVTFQLPYPSIENPERDLVIRVEAHSVRPDWPMVVGYARLFR